jgi:hypothetical protein
VERGSNRQTHPLRSIGVVGTACWKGEPGNWGRPAWDGGRASDIVSTMVSRASDRVVVLLRLGNAGGGKDPDFWYA